MFDDLAQVLIRSTLCKSTHEICRGALLGSARPLQLLALSPMLLLGHCLPIQVQNCLRGCITRPKAPHPVRSLSANTRGTEFLERVPKQVSQQVQQPCSILINQAIEDKEESIPTTNASSIKTEGFSYHISIRSIVIQSLVPYT